MTSTFCDTVKIRNVFLYPTEYITNGIGWNGVHEDITPIITRPDGSKEYRISDHLASLRVSLTNGSPTTYYDYDPWGSLLSGTPTRRLYNDREEDKENSLYNNGVRKLDDGLGRFTAIDPLWEKFRWQSPYVYGDNNPLGKTDPSGMQAIPVTGGVGVGVGLGVGSAPVAAGVTGAILLGADAAARTKMPALKGLPVGGALGVYIGLTLATEIYSDETSGEGSGGSGSSGGGSTPPSGGGGGGGLIGGLGAAGAKFAADEAAKRGTSVTRAVESVGMTLQKAGDFFGWGKRTTLTKSVSDFTKESLLQNGWTKEKLVQLARAYNEQVVKAQKAGATNPAGVVRRDQAMELARTYFGD